MAASPSLIAIVDIINIYGLIIIGLLYSLDSLSGIAAIAGALLLTLYYFAYPPFGDSLFNISEGHLFIVDKILIEALILIFFIFYKEKGFGIDELIERRKNPKVKTTPSDTEGIPYSESRREVLKNLATLPVLGFMGYWAGRLVKNMVSMLCLVPQYSSIRLHWVN